MEPNGYKMPTKVPNKERFLDKLLTSDVKRSKVVAIAFKANGAILCSAINQRCYGRQDKWTTHAEENLIGKLMRLKAKERFGRIYILVARWSRVNGWSNAKPCEKCRQEIERYGATTVYHTGSCGKVQKSA